MRILKLGEIVELDKPCQQKVAISIKAEQAMVVFYVPGETKNLNFFNATLLDEDNLTAIRDAYNRLVSSNEGRLRFKILVPDNKQQIVKEIKDYLIRNGKDFSGISTWHFDFNHFERDFEKVLIECKESNFTVNLDEVSGGLNIQPVKFKQAPTPDFVSAPARQSQQNKQKSSLWQKVPILSYFFDNNPMQSNQKTLQVNPRETKPAIQPGKT